MTKQFSTFATLVMYLDAPFKSPLPVLRQVLAALTPSLGPSRAKASLWQRHDSDGRDPAWAKERGFLSVSGTCQTLTKKLDPKRQPCDVGNVMIESVKDRLFLRWGIHYLDRCTKKYAYPTRDDPFLTFSVNTGLLAGKVDIAGLFDSVVQVLSEHPSARYGFVDVGKMLQFFYSDFNLEEVVWHKRVDECTWLALSPKDRRNRARRVYWGNYFRRDLARAAKFTSDFEQALMASPRPGWNCRPRMLRLPNGGVYVTLSQTPMDIADEFESPCDTRDLARAAAFLHHHLRQRDMLA